MDDPILPIRITALVHLRVMTVEVVHRTVEDMVTNLSLYAIFYYWTHRDLSARVLFCEAEYIREEDPNHESLFIRPLRYEYRL